MTNEYQEYKNNDRPELLMKIYRMSEEWQRVGEKEKILCEIQFGKIITELPFNSQLHYQTYWNTLKQNGRKTL